MLGGRAEDGEQKFGAGVGDTGVAGEVGRGAKVKAQPDDAGNLMEVAVVVADDGESIAQGATNGLAGGLGVEFGADRG